MKLFAKILSGFLVLLLLAACFTACGGEVEESETPEVTETKKEAEEQDDVKRDEYGRVWVDDSVPTDVNYANAENNTITFFSRMGTIENEMDVDELTDNTVNDAIYYRNTTVEGRLGVTIAKITQPMGTSAEITDWLQTVRNAVNTKSGDFDGAAIYASQGSPLALEGCYYNVLSMESLDLEKPWWNKDMIEGLELFNTLYFLGGDLMISETQQAGAMLYNKSILDKYYPDLDIYQLVTDYQWTVDKLYELSSTVWEDTNSSGMIDDGDTVGYVGFGSATNVGYNDIWQAAVGIQIVTKNNEGIPELTLYSEHAISAFEKLSKLHLSNTGAMPGGTDNTSFNLENVLFSIKALVNCESLRDMKTPYGALPLPMYDTEQGYYATYPHNGCSLLTILSTVTDDRIDMMGHTVELMAAESYRQVIPQYFEVCLKSKYSADASDAMMYDMIIDSIRFDFGLVFGSKSIAGVNTLFRDYSADFAQRYESSKTTYETALESLINKLDDLSFNMGA